MTGLVEDEPFVFPKDVDQVFYVDDNINVGWKLVVKVNPRSNLVIYKRAGGNSGDAVDDEAVAVEDNEGVAERSEGKRSNSRI